MSNYTYMSIVCECVLRCEPSIVIIYWF